MIFNNNVLIHSYELMSKYKYRIHVFKSNVQKFCIIFIIDILYFINIKYLT